MLFKSLYFCLLYDKGEACLYSKDQQALVREHEAYGSEMIVFYILLNGSKLHDPA